MTCTYTFKRKDGSTEKIVGQPALKAFLVKGGLAEFLPARELPAFSSRESNVLERIPALAEAAQGIKEGNVTREQYETLVNALKPVTPYADVPTPATVADMQRGLTSDKVERIGVPSETLKAGDPVGLRLDIPAYANRGVWVVAVHEQKAGYGAGTSIGYEGVAAVTEPTFGVVEKGALNIAAGKDKSTIAVMKGNWKPVTPKQALAAAKLAIKSDNWVQVGMDPTRHAYFYDRDNMEPVVSADEAIQIGPLVLAKNPVYGKKSDFAFSKRQELRDAADAIAKIPEAQRDNMEIGEYPGAASGYMLYEARQMLKKPSDKLKRVTDDNSFGLWQEYDYIANVDNEFFGISKQEDPDEPDDENKFVYAFAPLDNPDEGVITITDQKDELFKEMRASLGKAPAFQRREGDIGDALQDRINNDFDALVEEYNGLNGTDNGKVLDADIARELSPEYRADRSRASEVHEAVGNFIDKLYAKRIEEIGPNGVVAFMAGGGGAGKSSVQRFLGDRLNAADIVYDGTMSSYDSAKRRVQLALDAGHGVLISYVYRDPSEAVKNGVFPRAMKTGRTVPVAALVKGHAGSSEAIRKLQETFGDDPAFEIVAIDNSRGPNKAEVAPLASIPRVNVEGLKERLIDVTNEEYEAGRISGIISRTTLEGYTPGPGSTATKAAPTEGRRREGIQRRRELGGERDTVSFSQRGRETEGWILSRDELGRFRFGAGAKAYNLAANVANNVLDRIGLKPVSPELSRAMRKMKAEVERAQRLTVDVASKMKDLPEQERKMISDIIEGELKRGSKPAKHVLELAASIQSIMSEQSAELVRLGMLSPGAAGRWDGKYLPRFYEQKLGDEVKSWAKAAKALFGRQKTMQGIGGSSLKSRGMFENVPVEDLQDWLDEGWEVRDEAYDPATDEVVTVWRDYTRKERDDMGEIRDAMFRFVMGYNKSQRDIALGRLYENLAKDYASKKEQPGYIQVPTTKVEDTMARRYGKLAGKWVPAEIMDHLSGFDNSQQSELIKMYLKGLSMWKEGKTVLNPVSHANNVLSNLTMAHFAGVSYWDIGKYAGAIRDLVKNDPMVDEALDAGLFGGTFNRAELLNEMPEQLKALAQVSESRLKRGVDTVWNAMSWFVRKPAAKAYQAEDTFFRYLIYRDARKRGISVDDSIEFSQQFLFTYDDMPKTARGLRDFALPFFAYTYKVVPPLVRTALETPWRYAAPAGALYTVNALMYAMAASLGGGEDEDWWTVIRRYVTDPEFRNRVKEFESEERKNLPDWMKGYSATLGTPKAIRLGMDDVTNLPLFLDVSRVFPGGDLLDAHANAGGVPLLQPITPSNPILNTLGVMLWNKDSFFGKDIVDKSDTSTEAGQKRAKWMWQQFAPAVAIGNYHWDRAMNVIANTTGQSVLGYTGIDKGGLPVQPGYALANTVGIKIKPVDLELSEEISKSERSKLVRELEMKIKRINRLEGSGAVTEEAAEKERETLQEKKSRLKEGLTVEGKEPK